MRKIPIPNIPSDEQSRIVARIEELFSKLDKAVDTLKTTKEQLEVYRQAVLKDAFQEKENIIRLGDAIEKPRYGTSKNAIIHVQQTLLQSFEYLILIRRMEGLILLI